MWIWNELTGPDGPNSAKCSLICWREEAYKRSLYDCFGLSSDASAGQITKRYRELAREYHPDLRVKDNGLMAELNVAFEVLRDPIKRAAYDRKRGLLP